MDNFNNVYNPMGQDYEYSDNFSPLRSLTTLSSGLSLNVFNFLNLRDYGYFFTVTNTAKTHTLLISEFVYSLPAVNDFSDEAET